MARDAATTLIRGATVLAGEDLQALPDADVVIDGPLIAEVTAAHASSAANVVDATGLTLVPGFVDAHVHIAFASPADVVRAGVTTVRDLGWPPNVVGPLVAASRSPDFEGPAIHSVGPILTAPGGYPTRAGWAAPGTGLEVAGPAEASDAVDALASNGAAAIKIALNPPVGPVFDDVTLGTVCERAHQHGLQVTAHVFGLDQLERALEAGVDELAHWLLGPDDVPKDTIDRMVGAGMAVVPTLSCRSGADLRSAIASFARFVDAGGVVVYGTDLGNEGPRPGIDPLEVAAMAESGMSPRAIVASATTVARRRLGLEAGIISEGAPADVVALGGRPLDNAGDLTDVRMVWRAGRRVR